MQFLGMKDLIFDEISIAESSRCLIFHPVTDIEKLHLSVSKANSNPSILGLLGYPPSVNSSLLNATANKTNSVTKPETSEKRSSYSLLSDQSDNFV